MSPSFCIAIHSVIYGGHTHAFWLLPCSSPSSYMYLFCLLCYAAVIYSALKFHVPYYMFNIISHYPVHCMGPAYRRLNRRESCTIFTNTNKHTECRKNSSSCTSDLNPMQATCSYSLYIGMDHKSHIQNYMYACMRRPINCNPLILLSFHN